MKVLRFLSCLLLLALIMAMVLRAVPVSGLATFRLIVLGHLAGWAAGTMYEVRYRREESGDLPAIAQILLVSWVVTSASHMLPILLAALTIIPVMQCYRWIIRAVHYVDPPREPKSKLRFSHGRPS